MSKSSSPMPDGQDTGKIGWPDSVWAAVTAPRPRARALSDRHDTDILIIGAGFTGLSTALQLAAAGSDVTVIEAVEPGWGASGRNNGQVIPTLTRPEPDDIVSMHGEAGERLVGLLRDSAQSLFDLIRQFDLQAEAEQTGWIQPVHTPGRMKIAQRRVEQWARHGAGVQTLDRDTVRALTGSDIWHGGWANPTGGHVNPLALARSMATAAQARGAWFFDHTPALRIERLNSQWLVTTPYGQVRARALLLATNAYTGEVPGLDKQIAREVVPVLSWQMATRPLSAQERLSVIPGRQAVSDTHGDLYFMRYEARNRLVTGGALVVPFHGASRLRRRIATRLEKTFGALGPISFDHVWNGYIGMTTDFMPRFHQLGPDGYAWVGCNGRGVALSVALGEQFARVLRAESPEPLALPLTYARPLPGHAFIRRFAPLRLLPFRWSDRREI